MHPILAYRGRLGPYLAAWVPLGGMLAALFHLIVGSTWAESAAVALPLSLLYAFICLAAWYPCRSASPSAAAFPRIVATQLLAAALSAMLWLFLADTWVVLLAQVPRFAHLDERFPRIAPVLLGAGVLLYVLAAALHYLLMAFESARRAETQALELEVLAREAELRALRAQVDPHFLFNALNSVSSLIASDPAGAREMCLKLAEFLRESVRVGGARSIDLGEELALAERYLAVEQARFGARLRAQWRVEPGVRACQVPPLLIQPLVENAVRHGIAGRLEGGCVTVAAERAGDAIRLSVENPTDDQAPAAGGSGVGLENVRSRLAAAYGSDASVDVRRGGGSYLVTLVFPARPAAAG